ncbi:hypothetical protein L1987_19313 [Smallanthus sonchifolius]|uniref:Uncharacterized protein n=1 Tax=Smallanthus sonchifolius TaxID=185202 RepID=A0ACB9INY5_9ASTR|nr:hypothetical protein L1987_19313 [Smallanthus sonchifolius]
MRFKSFILLCVLLFALVLLVSSTVEVETSKDERSADKAPEEYHVNDGYGGGGWGGYGGGGWGGPGGGGWGGPGGGSWGGPGGGGGWGGPGGGGWGRGGRGYGGGGWGGPGGGWGGGGCRFGCCGRWFGYRGCSRCCRSLTEAIAFNEQEGSP